ncbi:polyketide cyclase [Amycolatopsis coloradensis]|uniref:Polyketide cyclase n=1 Tax=Amycolatopsis coloradensis TaxID=76021 RepID=A0A1R0KJM9_9PSEU|nr:SRPBCC family protein [Amycolatopsis coloradensis]OLZ46240.1 polyketide cyclase [Amycolatopsis coloradensis]
MVNVHRTITVRTPGQTVVDYLQDFAHAEEWDPGTVSCTRADTGPVVVGSRWHNVSEFRGKKTELTYRLERLEPGRIVFVGSNKTATSTDDLTVTEEDGTTSISYHATITFHGLAKLADPFLKREFEKMGDALVPTMRKALEAL